MKPFFILPILALAALGCSAKNNVNSSGDGAVARAQITEIRAKNAENKKIQAFCKIQDEAGVRVIETPAHVELPIGNGQPKDNIVLTCEHEGTVKTAILVSHKANAQKNLLVNATTGNALVSSQISRNSDLSGIGEVNDLLAIGLSTTAVAGNFFIYPKIVIIEF